MMVKIQKKKLIEKGHKVTVERSSTRCFSDEEFREAGAELAPSGSWRYPHPPSPSSSSSPSSTEGRGGGEEERREKIPDDAIVIGLKELEVEGMDQTFPLTHRHIYFAHCYKNQSGWVQHLKRFDNPSGRLDDMEFLVDDLGRRVAAFGVPAGQVGAALGLLEFCNRATNTTDFLKDDLQHWSSKEAMVADVRQAFEAVRLASSSSSAAESGQEHLPVVWIIGALGRVGSGAVEICRLSGIPESHLRLWDLKETAAGGPFDSQLQETDVLLNCVYLSKKIPPFIDEDSLERTGESRRLKVVSDISCDYTSANHPLPFFSTGTDLRHPVVRTHHANPISVIAIDHLPSLLPKESSVAFSNDLLPSLFSIDQDPPHPVWQRSLQTFQTHLARAKQEE
jgi:saccharopine dehydrogenase (NAD+, L-lysine forming)